MSHTYNFVCSSEHHADVIALLETSRNKSELVRTALRFYAQHNDVVVAITELVEQGHAIDDIANTVRRLAKGRRNEIEQLFKEIEQLRNEVSRTNEMLSEMPLRPVAIQGIKAHEDVPELTPEELAQLDRNLAALG